MGVKVRSCIIQTTTPASPSETILGQHMASSLCCRGKNPEATWRNIRDKLLVCERDEETSKHVEYTREINITESEWPITDSIKEQED